MNHKAAAGRLVTAIAMQWTHAYTQSFSFAVALYSCSFIYLR